MLCDDVFADLPCEAVEHKRGIFRRGGSRSQSGDDLTLKLAKIGGNM